MVSCSVVARAVSKICALLLQSPFGPSSFADLLSAPYSEETGALSEELDPFPDVVFHPNPHQEPPPPHHESPGGGAGPLSPVGPGAPLPSFEETYSPRYTRPADLPSTSHQQGYKMDEECYNVPTPYSHNHHHHHSAVVPTPAPSPYEFQPTPQQPAPYPYFPPQPQQSPGFEPTPLPQETYSLPPFPSTSELHVTTTLSPRQRRASLPLQRSESTR